MPVLLETRGIKSPGVGVTGRSEPPDAGAENWVLVLFRSSTHSVFILCHLSSPSHCIVVEEEEEVVVVVVGR